MTPDTARSSRPADSSSLASIKEGLAWSAMRAGEVGQYLAEALPAVMAALSGDFAALAVASTGRWSCLARAGTQQPLPTGLLADVLDQETAAVEGPWAAAPLATKGATGEVLLLHCRAGVESRQTLPGLADLAAALHEARQAVEKRQQERRRMGRLEALLEIAGKWNQTHEVEPLLVQMAEAATRLFGADRASIFLWDRRRKLLVGRPALGVPGGELRIPDDRGVVGQVIRTGEPLSVDAAAEPDRVDRQVDAQTGYRTRNLLCVPLRGRSGELFGAFELINKLAGTFTPDDQAGLAELACHAAIALENAQDRQQLLSTSRQITDQAAEQVRLIGQSRAMSALRSMTERVAATELAVLILGENGTGKEVVAQSIHYLSSRRSKPFVAVNCAAIPDTLAESELFGHEKGSFTDARDTRLGKFELAADGTLFLDEIGDLSLGGQAKLLRVLEERLLVRVGGSTPIHTDARVLAATNQNLAEMVRQKRFREDLYFRLAVVTLEIPPLRDRRDDILLLAEHLLADFCRKARRRTPEFTAAAKARLESHAWPGNVRELRNLMERIAYLSSGDVIDAEDLAFILSPRGPTAPVASVENTLAQATDEFQIDYIQRAIGQSDGNMSHAATKLGLHRSNLYRKMRQLGMSVPQ
jgi:transcriptional regulator with GAF, ATPase, and Fis domain